MTNKYNTIHEFDELAAEIYKDKQSFLTIGEIAKLRGMTTSGVKEKLNQAQYILKHSEQMWMKGLSKRTRDALLRNGYDTLLKLETATSENQIEILSKPSIGVQTIHEVLEWLKSK